MELEIAGDGKDIAPGFWDVYYIGTTPPATVELEKSPDGGTTWFPVFKTNSETAIEFTDSGQAQFVIADGHQIRADSTSSHAGGKLLLRKGVAGTRDE